MGAVPAALAGLWAATISANCWRELTDLHGYKAVTAMSKTLKLGGGKRVNGNGRTGRIITLTATTPPR